MAEEAPLRVVEFYCGLGGFHAALARVDARARVVAAYDINPVGNDVYAHNFGAPPPSRQRRC